MTRLIAFILLWPSMVLADTQRPGLPALYQVKGVSANDTLNVRAGPDTTADILGSLAADLRDVEVIDLSLEGKWAQINYEGQVGWVALRYLQRQPVEAGFAGLPAGLSCFGTEPFWTLTVGADGVAISRPEGDELHANVTTLPRAPRYGPGDPVFTGSRYNWQANGGTEVTSMILPGQCSDGMSDAIYGLHYVDNYLPNTGCCSLS